MSAHGFCCINIGRVGVPAQGAPHNRANPCCWSTTAVAEGLLSLLLLLLRALHVGLCIMLDAAGQPQDPAVSAGWGWWLAFFSVPGGESQVDGNVETCDARRLTAAACVINSCCVLCRHTGSLKYNSLNG
jgi:hypothetical protein